MKATNPVLRGWHPDPCICKGPDGRYFLVVSTFQWLPAISCYESRDLVHWTSRGGLLPNLDLSGIPDSAGIWAPDLTYADGRFWLVYTIARGIDGIFKDVENYLVTSPSIEGPWSEPRLLNVSGFDPGVFHEGGRHYVANPQWDPRPLPGHRRFNGIILQEFDEYGLVGEAREVLDNNGAVNGLREGPHILKHDGCYYLACAEGGTGRRHRIRMARSESLWGPYEVCPEPLVCAWGSDARLRKAGHGNLFEGPGGSWYACHLCSRYLPGTERGRGKNGAYTEKEAGCSVLGRGLPSSGSSGGWLAPPRGWRDPAQGCLRGFSARVRRCGEGLRRRSARRLLNGLPARARPLAGGVVRAEGPSVLVGAGEGRHSPSWQGFAHQPLRAGAAGSSDLVLLVGGKDLPCSEAGSLRPHGGHSLPVRHAGLDCRLCLL